MKIIYSIPALRSPLRKRDGTRKPQMNVPSFYPVRLGKKKEPNINDANVGPQRIGHTFEAAPPEASYDRPPYPCCVRVCAFPLHSPPRVFELRACWTRVVL